MFNLFEIFATVFGIGVLGFIFSTFIWSFFDNRTYREALNKIKYYNDDFRNNPEFYEICSGLDRFGCAYLYIVLKTDEYIENIAKLKYLKQMMKEAQTEKIPRNLDNLRNQIEQTKKLLKDHKNYFKNLAVCEYDEKFGARFHGGDEYVYADNLKKEY